MMTKHKDEVFLDRWAFGLIIFGAGCIGQFLFIVFQKKAIGFNALGIEIIPLFFGLLYFISGIGIKIRNKWAYYSYNFSLAFILLLLPFGTILSLNAYKRIKADNLKSLFRKI